jgi:glycosyltransferase involved in cell wall biosynthesis
MKILQVVHYFPPLGRGGAELYTYQLSIELLKFHDVRLFFTIPDDRGSGKIEEGCYNGIPYWAIKKDYCTFDQPFHERSELVEREFSKTLDSFKPDIIHFQHLCNLSLALPSLAKKAGIPCCFTLHDFWLLCPLIFFLNSEMKICNSYSLVSCVDCIQDRIGYYTLPSKGFGAVHFAKNYAKKALNFKKRITAFLSIGFWRAYWVKKILKTVNIFIAPSQFLRMRFVKHGLSPQKIIFTPHGYKTKTLSGVKKTSSPILRFAFIGTMQFHKGIYVLIDAFNGVAGPHELRLYGSVTPESADDLRKKIKNPHIHIMGELKDEDKRNAFTDIDILIVPSICCESYSLVINEAFITKTPVIVSNIGAMAERIQDGVTGLTFPPGDSAALAEKINVFIRNPQLIQSFAAQIPIINDIQTHAAELSNIYKKIAGRQNEQL